MKIIETIELNGVYIPLIPYKEDEHEFCPKCGCSLWVIQKDKWRCPECYMLWVKEVEKNKIDCHPLLKDEMLKTNWGFVDPPKTVTLGEGESKLHKFKNLILGKPVKNEDNE